MYDGKQVLRVETKYKQKDLYNIGIEMTQRKGTGNYDKNRTQFNIEYVSMNERNLYQEVKTILKNKNIEYLNKPNTNLLNGITFTSGPEFFETLGMKFVNSGRTYKTGNKKGQNIKIPYIKSQNDIPQAVSYYFDSCMDYLKEFVGEDNIVLAQIHYDEDTPHLQAYFMPIVNEVKRKCYVKDENGNVIKEEVKNKSGEITVVPKLLRDEKGKIVYETKKGKFLNNDQFWKNKGGKNSYAKMQDSFNKFITSRGFKLDRGNIGTSVVHKSKLEYDIEEKKAELKELKREKENVLNIIESSKNGLENAKKSQENEELLNPVKRKIGGYKDSDVIDIIEYTKTLQQENIVLNTDNKNKDLEIQKLSTENEIFKNNEELIKRNKIIKEQKKTIKEQDKEINRLKDLINILQNNVDILKNKLEQEIEKWKILFNKMCNAINKVLKIKPKKYVEDYEDLADAINNDYYDYDKKEENKDDLEIGI